MTPPNIQSSPPPLPYKPQIRRPSTAKSTRTLSNSSIPTLATARLATQPSPSSSSATLIQHSPLQPRRPPRSAICPSSSRPPLPHSALDPSQDHHRSDSGRSTGSSRSTATTDSFFLPQHPHPFNRRLKDLPSLPPSSSFVDSPTPHRPHDAPASASASASALDLNLTIASSVAPALVPPARLFRSQSSISTTPTSPEDGSGSPLGGSVTADHAPLDDANAKLQAQHADSLDDFWQADYSYARPSTEMRKTTLPPLLRSNAPIPPSRSQSLDPLAEPLDANSVDSPSQHNQSSPVGSAVPLLAANLQKLNSQNDLRRNSVSVTGKLASPNPSSLSGVLTPTRCSDDARLAVPCISPYQQPAIASASSSSSAVDHRPQPNKSSSSLSASSAHDHDRITLSTASKRSSASSSSSFRMTLSRQAKTLRNSFMWTPPTTDNTIAAKKEPSITSSLFLSPDSLSTPISQASSPTPAVRSPQLQSSVLTSTQLSSHNQGILAPQQHHCAFPPISSAKTSVPTTVAASTPSSFSSTDVLPKRTASKNANTDASLTFSASANTDLPNPNPKPKKPATDYGKTADRSRSRLSSRITLQNANWSMKISNMKTKNPTDASAFTSTTSHVGADASSRTTNRRSKSQASLSSALTAASANTIHAEVRDTAERVPRLESSKAPASLLIDTTPVSTSESSGVDPRLSPSFAATFAFLNSEIDSTDHSPLLVSTMLPSQENAQNAIRIADRASLPASVIPAIQSSPEHKVSQTSVTDLYDTTIATPSSQPEPSRPSDAEDARAQSALFDRLADSPEAVHKTLVLPDPLHPPASTSFDRVSAASQSTFQRHSHKKHMSLGSTTLISKSARKAASDLDKRACVASSGLPLTNVNAASRWSFASALPLFTPMSEDGTFFDALTSPLDEQPSNVKASPSPPDNSVLPSFATATEFFPLTKTEPVSPVHDQPFTPCTKTTVAAQMAATAQAMPPPNRSSLGRRLSGVVEPSKVRSSDHCALASPSQSTHAETMRRDALPARPETSLGFYLRNPLRKERKASQKAAQSLTPTVSRTETSSTASHKSPTSAIRRMSTGFRLDRSLPVKKELTRAETSLGMAASEVKSARLFSSRVLAPTKSSLARSVQRSPPSTGSATAKSSPASSLATPITKALSRSPQRPTNPPSSYRGSPAASSRPSVSAVGSAFKSTPSSKAPLSSTSRGRTSSSQDVATSMATGQDALPAAPSNPTNVRRRRTLSKPLLNPIRTSFSETRNYSRPSTAIGFRGGMTAADRKMSQPTLDMVDDREFLEALEQVRAVQRERIQAEAQKVENKSRLARLGMASGNHLKTKNPESALDKDNNDTSTSPNSLNRSVNEPVTAAAPTSIVPARPRLRHKRSASADAQLAHVQTTTSVAAEESDRDIDQRQKDIVKAYADKQPLVGPPTSGLEWGVGKASGKLHDGAFVNDDDWKKEVKALFLIRELVQTERSYSRHLSSLLGVIRKMPVAPGSNSPSCPSMKRKSTSNLFAAYSSAVASKTSPNASPPSHIALMRTYLPQLIALSNALVQRVEENPTSAGVGGAFDMLAAQLESTFVGWSGVASQALAELRSTEMAKSKSPFKIGLVPLMPRESTEVGASTADAVSSASGSSTPGSSFRNAALRMTSFTRPTSPVVSRRDSNAPADGNATVTTKRSTKRRSTITSTSFHPPPRVVVAAATVLSSSPEQDKEGDSSAFATTTTAAQRFGHLRSQSTLVTPLPTPTSSTAPDPWSAPPPSGGKSLTPMDIAIMPTQRLPRYGLMLRDLLRNTPPESLSHVRVQRAIGLIQKVAGLCDAVAPVGVTGGRGTSGNSSGAVPSARARSVMGVASTDFAVNAGSSITDQ